MEKINLNLEVRHDLTHDVWYAVIRDNKNIVFSDDSQSRSMIMSKVINYINNSIK
jgi:hypothetical protein